MSRTDPLGKRALFSVTADEPERPRARSLLDVDVRCSACDARARTDLLSLAVRHLPLWVWMPGRKPGHLMRCASCHEVAWHDIARPR
jgi:hypothetical protein